MSRFSFCFLAMLPASFFTATSALAQKNVLGKIDSPNSGAAEAQDPCLNGVRMLHSFSWVDAARASKGNGHASLAQRDQVAPSPRSSSTSNS